MVETFTSNFPMLIQLNDSDLSQMPVSLRTHLLNWVQTRQMKPNRQAQSSQTQPSQIEAYQLPIDFENLGQAQQEKKSSPVTIKLVKPSHDNLNPSTPKQQQIDQVHVRLSQLFDAGIFTQATLLRVKLKKEHVKKCGYTYITTGLKISSKGTVLYKGEEFDKPSPLAQKINGSPVNGWEYVEAKKNGQWVCLNELRKTWRKAND
ncbi:MAG: hypothetical protein ACKPEN_09895 [Planktothrix sp.]|uniref:hypothetical protein n=1 Tax=Planktothrix sp. TaxID=3088171 RepID=UPI0038D4D8E2